MEATLRRPLPALAAVGLALAWLSTLVVGVALEAAPARAMGQLPACRYADITTAPEAYADWPVTLVDTILRVPSTYVPPDLVSTRDAGLAGAGLVRKIALADLTAMAKKARAAGAPIAVQSAYRSYTQQKTTFQGWVNALGYAGALKVSARPGHSEHQLGLAIDFRSDAGGPPWEGDDWAKSPAGAWMLANAWKFGWVLSYPRDAFDTVCYSYEPWHYRYVGRALAAKIHESGLTIRAYLWANYTTAVVPPVAAASPSASPDSSGAPSGSPGELPSGEPSLSPTTPEPTIASPTAEATAPVATSPAGPTGFPEDVSTTGLALIGLGAVVAIGLGVFLASRARPRSDRQP